MSYFRVIPRDLFNEAALLKCYGRLWICLDECPIEHTALLEHDGAAFDIIQNNSDGSITLRNVFFSIGNKLHRLWHPLNSKEPWSLWLGYDTRVFNEEGNLTSEFLEQIKEK